MLGYGGIRYNKTWILGPAAIPKLKRKITFVSKNEVKFQMSQNVQRYFIS